MDLGAKIVLIFLGLILLIFAILGLSLLLSWPVMIAWNYVMPYLFGFKTITWLQSWALCWLAGALIKSTQSNTNKAG